jgi:O-antigen ligase
MTSVSRRINTASERSAAATAPHVEPWPPNSLFAGLHWSLAFIGFLVYIYVVTTYRFPLGSAGMALALLTVAAERTGLRMSPVVGWAAALLAWAAIGWTTTDYQSIVAAELLDFAKVCAVVFVAVNVITTRARLRFFLVLFLGLFALYPVRGAMVSYFLYGGGNFGRAAWNFVYSNANDLAGFCLLQFSLAAGLAVTERTRWIRWCAAAGMAVLPLLIVLTASRAGFIALLAFVAVAFWRHVTQVKRLVVIVTIAAVIVILVPDNLWRRIGAIRDVKEAQTSSQVEYQSSTAQRLALWKVARAIIAENPVLGVGLGAYSEAHLVMARRPGFDATVVAKKDAHSTYLRLGAELGVVGLAIFLGLIVATVREAEGVRRRARQTRPRLAAQLFYMEVGLFAYLVAGIWGSWGTLAFTYIHLALIHVAARLLRDEMDGVTPVSGRAARVSRRGGYALRPQPERT